MILSPEDIQALLLTLKLAAVSTAFLLVLGTPLAWWLAHTRWSAKYLLESVIALPLVLPPTVLGFYLLVALGPNGIAGDITLAFTFEGLVIGSVIYSLPFVVQPLQDAFINVGRWPLEVAATLRTSPIKAFFRVAVPLARPGFVTAAILGFAHTLGEFGVVLMIGGNIPGETRVASIAIYDHVESIEYAQAHMLSAVLLIISFLMLVAVFAINRRFRTVRL